MELLCEYHTHARSFVFVFAAEAAEIFDGIEFTDAELRRKLVLRNGLLGIGLPKGGSPVLMRIYSLGSFQEWETAFANAVEFTVSHSGDMQAGFPPYDEGYFHLSPANYHVFGSCEVGVSSSEALEPDGAVIVKVAFLRTSDTA